MRRGVSLQNHGRQFGSRSQEAVRAKRAGVGRRPSGSSTRDGYRCGGLAHLKNAGYYQSDRDFCLVLESWIHRRGVDHASHRSGSSSDLDCLRRVSGLPIDDRVVFAAVLGPASRQRLDWQTRRAENTEFSLGLRR